ncbi:MAG: dihydrolipoamide acetyltransferase family protein, partial [Gemmatimonadaceae bacterium]
EALSPTMEEGRLVKWFKNEGDAVKTGDVLAEVETDKAVMELVARGDGILKKRLANEGDSSAVGTLLAVIGAADENIDALIAGAGTPAPAETAPAEATPSEAALAAGPQGGDAAPAPAPAPVPASQGTEAVQQPAAARNPAAPAMPQPPLLQSGSGFGARSSSAPSGGAPAGDGKRSRSSPLARRLASERGIELSQIQGSGPGGRIVKKDVETAIVAPAGAQRAAAPAKKTPRFITRDGDYQDIPNTQIRKTIARRLAESIGPVPTYYLTAEFDAGRASDMRAQLKELGDDYKVSFNDIVIKAVANALSEHPEVNAWWMGDHIRHFNRVHVAMAVAIPEGLITPVIFDADKKGLGQIAAEARELAGKAKSRKLTPEQYTGSTFSVSNLGMLGIDEFTAIINPPEAGILAVGAVEPKPVVEDGAVVVRQRMRVTMSCDHRVIDGATGARFLQTVKRNFENPLLLVI